MEGNKLGAMGMPVQGWDLHAGSSTLPRDELRLMSFCEVFRRAAPEIWCALLRSQAEPRRKPGP